MSLRVASDVTIPISWSYLKKCCNYDLIEAESCSSKKPFRDLPYLAYAISNGEEVIGK